MSAAVQYVVLQTHPWHHTPTSWVAVAQQGVPSSMHAWGKMMGSSPPHPPQLVAVLETMTLL